MTDSSFKLEKLNIILILLLQKIYSFSTLRERIFLAILKKEKLGQKFWQQKNAQ